MTDVVRPLLRLPRAAIMGIVNTTPDSFSDGGRFSSADDALKHVYKLIDEGADIIDIGGESTQPGAKPVAEQEEIDRVVPLVERVKSESDIPISIDTSKPQVMQCALGVGADMINDVNGLLVDGAIAAVANAKVPVCIMHMQKRPETMQARPYYGNVANEVIRFLESRVDACVLAGIPKDDLIVDPGIGFGKTLDHNLTLLNEVPRLRRELACAVMIGVSRKSMIGNLLDRKLDERMPASIGLAVQAVLNGAKIVRVHDVRATFDAVRSVEAVAGIN